MLDTKFLCPYFWADLKYKIKCFFIPKNKWATRVIPREWRDKDYIFEEVLFAGIVDFVENEKCFEVNSWTLTLKMRRNKEKIEEIYKWAKTGREEIREKIKKAYPKISLDEQLQVNKKKFSELYGEVNRLEELMEETNTKHLKWIVENRNILWS
jgi:hypothetical protein